MKSLIKKLLREEMLSMVNDYLSNLKLINDNKTITYNTLISKDDETGNKLYLFVGFIDFKYYSEYSYAFILLDKDNKPLSDYLTNRKEVSKFLPSELKNNNKIFPLIMDITRKLMNEKLPQNIIRKTVEPISGDSLKRYEEITKIMVNEYNYKLIEVTKDDWGITTWKLTRNEINDKNKEMNESYELSHQYSIQEIAKMTFDHILPTLPKL